MVTLQIAIDGLSRLFGLTQAKKTGPSPPTPVEKKLPPALFPCDDDAAGGTTSNNPTAFRDRATTNGSVVTGSINRAASFCGCAPAAAEDARRVIVIRTPALPYNKWEVPTVPSYSVATAGVTAFSRTLIVGRRPCDVEERSLSDSSAMPGAGAARVAPPEPSALWRKI